MGACSSKHQRHIDMLDNQNLNFIENKKIKTSIVPFSPIKSTSIQNTFENLDQNNQLKWIQQIICHYRQGDETPKTLQISQVADSHHANSFNAVGRVISVFNDDIVYNEKSFYYGTGSIINPRVVLTAAHVLRHGVLNVLANYVYFELQSAPDKPKKYIRVKRYGFHRNFIDFQKDGKDKQSQKHDIALLILEQNDIISPQMTLGVQLNYKFTKQAHPKAFVSGYPHHLNIGTEPFKQFWAQIKPSSALHNFLLYENLLGGGFSGSPLMIKVQQNEQSRFMVFAVHKGQIGSKGYSVCLNSINNKLNELLKYFSIEDVRNSLNAMQSISRVKQFEKQIQFEENKLFYQSDALFLDGIRWSRQIRNTIELRQFLQKLQNAGCFKKGMQEIKFSIYSLFKQAEQQNRCLFRYAQWKYFFQLFKNLYLNDEEQQKLLNLLLRMVKLNFQFDPRTDKSVQCKQIGSIFHYFWNSVSFKTRTWCKQHEQNTQNNLNLNTQKIKFKISNIIIKGYQSQINFKQRKRTKSECLLWFYYSNKNLERADKLLHTISRAQQQENPGISYIKGHIMSQIGDLQKAQEYFIKYLKLVQKDGIIESIINEANALYSIGIVYQKFGNYENALIFYKRSSQIFEKFKGKDSIESTNILNNICNIYRNQGKYENALEFYKKSLEIYERVKGKDSIQCANTFNNMSIIYQIQGNYQDALFFNEKALQIKENLKGKNSIDSVNTLNNMGILYKNQGKYEDALVFYKKSLQIIERVKGKDSIDCADRLNNIGVVYKHQNKYQDALVFYKRSLQIYQRLNGQDSIDGANIMCNMGLVYQIQGRNEEALIFYKRSLQIKERKKGKQSADCIFIVRNIALTQQKLKQPSTISNIIFPD